MRTRLGILALVVLLTAPLAGRADYLDVITVRLGDCTLEKYLSVVEEFRGVIKAQNYDYSVEIAVPLTNNELDVVYWVGRTPSFQSFGEGYSRWTANVAKPGTPENKMNEKFEACGENVSRSGHMIR